MILDQQFAQPVLLDFMQALLEIFFAARARMEDMEAV
jgi:hypothetical protein